MLTLLRSNTIYEVTRTNVHVPFPDTPNQVVLCVFSVKLSVFRFNTGPLTISFRLIKRDQLHCVTVSHAFL